MKKAGQVRAPREDTPAMAALVDVGTALLSYASSSGEQREPMLYALREAISVAQRRMKAPGCVPVPAADPECKTGGKGKLPVVAARSQEQFGSVWPRLPPSDGKPIEVVLLLDDGAATEQCIRVRVKRGIGAGGHEHAFGFGTGLPMHDVVWTLIKARGRGENPVLVVP